MLGDRRTAAEYRSGVVGARSKPYRMHEDGTPIVQLYCNRCGIPLSDRVRFRKQATGLCYDCLLADQFYLDATGVDFKRNPPPTPKKKTHCKRGHRLAGANSKVAAGRTTQCCVICNRAAAVARSRKRNPVTIEEAVLEQEARTDEMGLATLRAARGEDTSEGSSE